MTFEPIIRHMTDQDAYKFSMGQAVMHQEHMGVRLGEQEVEYKFIDRNGGQCHPDLPSHIIDQAMSMADLSLSDNEAMFLRRLPFIRPSYIEWLSNFRYNPHQVTAGRDSEGRLILGIRGPWETAIFWEVPLLALVSELTYRLDGLEPDPKYRAASEQKARDLESNEVLFADFGTRRRFSFDVQRNVVDDLSKSDTFLGTSNVYLAMLADRLPIGTQAHEWYMALAALFGWRMATRIGLELWTSEYRGDLGIALTDTFTTRHFFQVFDMFFSKLFDGLRHDSGDPLEFAELAMYCYRRQKVDPRSKTLVFSDGLTTAKAIEIANALDGKVKTSFGIGTHFTNDVGVDPLNIVIKMVRCGGRPTVKLSDIDGKHTGDPQAIRECISALGI